MERLRSHNLKLPVGIVLAAFIFMLAPVAHGERLNQLKSEWPNTDFSRSAVPFSEILSGGPGKDGIPAIIHPQFSKVSDVDEIGPREPVISLVVSGEARAYPLRIMMWHEIANDVIGGVPVIVTYCPLCNAAMVFDRRVDDEVLLFGVSGKLRHSDMIMYDLKTESWWQQFLGKGIVGEMMDEVLVYLPSRVMPFEEFARLHPDGQVLQAPTGSNRRYGENPYVKYDESRWPSLFQSTYDGPVPPMAYVVATGDDAWPLQTIREAGQLAAGDIRITWRAGMNSALGHRKISKGRDLGFVSVERRNAAGTYDDVPHEVTFAFAFLAFVPDGTIHTAPDEPALN